MNGFFGISQVLAAALNLLAVISLVLASSGAGHAESHSLGHAQTETIVGYGPTSAAEAPDNSSIASFAACNTDKTTSAGQQTSDNCCSGFCMSVALYQSHDAASHFASVESYVHNVEPATSVNALALERPPRDLI